MATVKTPAKPPAIAAKRTDPGPPPAMPRPTGADFGMERLRAAGQVRDRETILALQTMRLSPAVAIYKAELLSWLDALEAYEARLG